MVFSRLTSCTYRTKMKFSQGQTILSPIHPQTMDCDLLLRRVSFRVRCSVLQLFELRHLHQNLEPAATSSIESILYPRRLSAKRNRGFSDLYSQDNWSLKRPQCRCPHCPVVASPRWLLFSGCSVGSTNEDSSGSPALTDSTPSNTSWTCSKAELGSSLALVLLTALAGQRCLQFVRSFPQPNRAVRPS